jgi:apolipoprotein N-acyltransferase
MVVAAAAGGGMALAFPPFDLWWLAPVSVAALVLVLHHVAGPSGLRRGARGGALSGALVGGAFGLTFFGVLTPWLRVIGPDAFVLIVVLSLAFTALFGAGAVVVMTLPGWPLWVASWWVAVEALRGRVPFGGFPWGRLGHSQAEAPTAGWVALGGVPMLTFVVVLAGVVAAWAVLQLRWRRWVRAGLGTVGVACLLMGGLAVPTPTAGSQITVAVVQGSVPDTGMDAFGRRQAVLDAHLSATHRLAADVRAGQMEAPDVVIWPENASDIDPSLDAAAYDAISAAVDDVGVPVLVGLVVEARGGANVANQGTVWAPGDGPGETYVKQNLVPFGEYVPLRDQLDGLISRLDRIPRDFVAGDRPGLLRLGPTTVGDVICFDVAYDAAVREPVAEGAQLITVQTNNATYGRTGQVEQQWAISRLRAIENGRSVVVASTSGISGVIAPDGRVQERAPEFEPAVIVAPVTLRDDLTLATRIGAWPEIVLSLVGVIAIGAGLFVARRRRDEVKA